MVGSVDRSWAEAVRGYEFEMHSRRARVREGIAGGAPTSTLGSSFWGGRVRDAGRVAAETNPAALLSRGGTAAMLLLPRALEARQFGSAWSVAVAAHVALVGLIAIAPRPGLPEEPPPIRLVFVEPAPPPPAMLGTPTGAGTEPVGSESEAVPVAPERAEPIPPKPEPRLRLAPRAKGRPRVAPNSPRPRAPARGLAAGSPGGHTEGSAGGVVGGSVGGVVGGMGTAAVPASQVAHPPQIIRRVSPSYPAEARRSNIEGLVVIEAILDRDGRIEAPVKVLKSVPQLDAEAVAAVRQWRFRPARDAAGKALRVILEIPIRFVLT